jgi:hypothetical protein
VIDGEAVLVLPLMDHLVQQRLGCSSPAIAPEMPKADDDRRLTL